MKGERKELGAGERFLSGSLAGVMSQTIIYPMEVWIIFCYTLSEHMEYCCV